MIGHRTQGRKRTLDASAGPRLVLAPAAIKVSLMAVRCGHTVQPPSEREELTDGRQHCSMTHTVERGHYKCIGSQTEGPKRTLDASIPYQYALV